jgi:RNA recognition motif-containing protein
MAYVTFSKYYHESPLNILEHFIDGQSCPIFKITSKINPNYEHVQSSRTIMCSGPIHDISEGDINYYFGKFGQVCKFVRKRDSSNPGKYQRFAFIRYNEKNAVDKIMEEKNHVIKGQIVDIRRVKDRA